MKIKGFITHKQAEKYEDCQDYFAINKKKGRLAISDGMSQSIFPQWWAEELVRAYVDDDWLPSQNDLEDLRKKWLNRVHEFLKLQKQHGNPTWMLENCLIEKRGAGATFCGICFENAINWEGYILGDSCLIEVVPNNEIIKFERSKEGDFNNNPDYFDSIVGGKGDVKKIRGSIEEGTKLLLVTDALAEFLYTQKEKGNEAEYIHQLLQIENHDGYCELIENWRGSKNLHNDDTTLLIVEYDGTSSINISFEDKLMELINKEDISINNPEIISVEAEVDNAEIIREIILLIDRLKKIIQQQRLPKYKKRLFSFCDQINERIKSIKDGKAS